MSSDGSGDGLERREASAPRVTRRQLLGLGSCAIAAVCGGCAGSVGTDLDGGEGDAAEDGSRCGARGTLDVGPVSAFAVDTLTPFAANRIYVGRDAQGFWAVDSICTHALSPTEVRADGNIRCLQPNATGIDGLFDRDGRVAAGPPPRALANHAVVICDGRVVVDLSSRAQVPSGTRTPAP